MRIKKSIKKMFLLTVVIGVSTIILFFIIALSWIRYEVKNQCQNANRLYKSDNCVESLITIVDDQNRGFRERNSAIWALGQLRDSRSLPTLQKYYTGIIPPREPLDTVISQYELKKAINMLNY